MASSATNDKPVDEISSSLLNWKERILNPTLLAGKFSNSLISIIYLVGVLNFLACISLLIRTLILLKPLFGIIRGGRWRSWSGIKASESSWLS